MGISNVSFRTEFTLSFIDISMEDSKQSINLNLKMENSDDNESDTAKQNCDETDGSSQNWHLKVVKSEGFPLEPNEVPNKLAQDAEESKVYADSGTLENIKNESLESTITPQQLWRRRCEASLRVGVEVKDSPSKYASIYKAVRMPFSPSTPRARDFRSPSDGRSAYLMNARKIRMQTAESGQRSHFRSFSQYSVRNRNEEFNGILRRPRRSLDSAAGSAFQTQDNMCLSPQNVAFSFSPYPPYPSLCTAPRLNGGDPSSAENVSYFDVRPKFESYQLVGDSLFVRFAEQLLNIPCGTVEGSRGIGLCVSGQKSSDLFRRVCNHMYPVSEKIVLLIGTNDVLQNIPQMEMCDTLGRLLVVLRKSVRRIVLLTLPPIPRLQLNPEHWEKIECYNNFIRSLQDEVVSVADIHHLYVTEKKACKMEMFERFYGDGQRVDLIHLNRSGLEEIQKFLLQNNFVN